MKFKLNNILFAMRFRHWLAMLYMYKSQIHPHYYFKCILITICTFLRSGIRFFNRITCAFRPVNEIVAKTSIQEDPIFILGFWRSGTTHLHYLLAHDDHVATPTSRQTLVPEFDFLKRRRAIEILLDIILPEKRAMDGMKINQQSPQEEEIAMLVTNNYSPMIWLALPKSQKIWGRYFNFEQEDPSIRERWKANYIRFLKMVTSFHKKQLLLKSPTNTARIKLLLEMFPNAKFVHISRNPYEVFLSTRHFFNTLGKYMQLQTVSKEELDQIILDLYAQVNTHYLQEKEAIPEGQLCEVSYENLCKNPMEEIETIYQTLKIDRFDQVKPKLQAYLKTVKDYQPNAHQKLSETQRDRIYQHWERFFKLWNYDR